MNFEKNNLEVKQDSNKLVEMKRLFANCFEAQKIEDGDILPVGGSYYDEMDISLEIDSSKMRGFVDEAQELAGRYNLSAFKEWLDLVKAEIDEKLFATLFAFTKRIESEYPENPERGKTRKDLYNRKDKITKLSEIFDVNAAECVEFAVLAQTYLQRVGVSSTYFAGSMVGKYDNELSCPSLHSFIIIREGGKLYIYDPANPIEDTGLGALPALYIAEADFDKEMAKGERKFVTAENILTKRKMYYGISDSQLIYVGEHIAGLE